MKEHGSRISEPGDRIYFYSRCENNKKDDLSDYYINEEQHNIDSNNFLHSLEDNKDPYLSWYYIHGYQFTKEEFEIERNRLLMLKGI